VFEPHQPPRSASLIKIKYHGGGVAVKTKPVEKPFFILKSDYPLPIGRITTWPSEPVQCGGALCRGADLKGMGMGDPELARKPQSLKHHTGLAK